MEINRIWEMPNSKTFKIRCIKKLIKKHLPEHGLVVDPFANECSIKEIITTQKYVSNDLSPDYPTDFHLEAQDFMKKICVEGARLVLYDPPYSGRQVSECYKKLGRTVNMEDTNSGYWVKFKKEISRILPIGCKVISFGWSSNGVGKKYGFEIEEILLVAHGGGHYDTICTVEKKVRDICPECLEEVTDEPLWESSYICPFCSIEQKTTQFALHESKDDNNVKEVYE